MSDELMTVCEICQLPRPWVGTLPFKRGKNREVCVMCLAEAIQGTTGFKMVSMVSRMIEQRVLAPQLSAAAKAIQASIREKYDQDE